MVPIDKVVGDGNGRYQGWRYAGPVALLVIQLSREHLQPAHAVTKKFLIWKTRIGIFARATKVRPMFFAER